MNIILRQDVENLGSIGDVVTVKDGYARNFLIPRGLAYYASPKAVKILEAEKRQYAIKMAAAKTNAESIASKLSDLQITIPMQTGEENRIFGTVTPAMIAQELTDRGFQIDRKVITIPEHIKTLGTYEVAVKLHSEVTATLKIWVTSAA